MLGHKVRYFGTLKLFEHIALARATASVHRCFDQLAATDLIILDRLAHSANRITLKGGSLRK